MIRPRKALQVGRRPSRLPHDRRTHVPLRGRPRFRYDHRFIHCRHDSKVPDPQPVRAPADSARTVQDRAQDIVAIHAKLKFTTLIVVSPTEKMKAATGDKDVWVADVVGNFCFVHPAK